MKSRFCFAFVIIYFTALLILAVYLRSSANRTFYKIYKIDIELSRLIQKLTQKQLELEGLTNPAAVSERLKIEE